MATKTYQIEKLDHGYIVISEGKKTAIENYKTLKEVMVTEMERLIQGITQPHVCDFTISIDTWFNTPKAMEPSKDDLFTTD